MAGVSKNSRASRTSTPNRAPGGIGKIFIPTGAGARAYVFNPATGTNPNFAVSSTELADAVRGLVEAGHGEKVAAEVADLDATYPGAGWDKVSELLAA